VLSAVGLVVAISSAVALNGNRRAIAKLADLGAQRTGQNAMGLPPVIALRSRELSGSELRSRKPRGDDDDDAPDGGGPVVSWLYPWRLLPWALALAWLLIPVLRALRQ
jgi:hypothetical protein